MEFRQNQSNKNIQAILKQTLPTKLGQGTYGIILAPALPNVINGKVTEFPENITKLYLGKNAANKSEKFASFKNILSKINPNNSTKRRYSVHKYAKQYKKTNLPQNYLKLLSNNQKEKIGNTEINIPEWIQDHISQSYSYIKQANDGYHEYQQ
jgi:hypothetical protein